MAAKKSSTASKKGLALYRRKRDFSATPEPSSGRSKSKGMSFVVQEHHARSHHYDFRLEMDGVLVSWAVPKGPPEDPAAKRLAVHVEDHPLDYGKFQGEIPKGHYGAGKVAIWDKGYWEPVNTHWKKDFNEGKLKFILHGGKMTGTYLLARMKEEPNWLMRKLDDTGSAKGGVAKEKPSFVSPQLARVVPSVPSGRDWIHEIKLDGYRLIAVKASGKLRLFTRNELDWTDRFKNLAAELGRLSSKDFVLDGEAVVFDSKGRSNFGDLQAALQKSHGGEIDFVAFDLLHLDGENLRNLPLSDRIERLAKLVPEETGRVRHSRIWPASQGKSLFTQACKSGLEGIISKPATSPYLEKSRSAWVKSKCRARQEFVICGYTDPRNSCPGFGALVLGSLEQGKLVPRGKVGTGFTDSQRRSLLTKLHALKQEKPNFRDGGKDVTWIEPALVAEIEFAEITRDGSIRQGSFIGLREDKAAGDVHLDSLQVAKPDAKQVKVSGIVISHPERLVYPADQVTKLEVATYYEKVGEWMMPYVANRPLAIIRAPSGITAELFFQKSFTKHIPAHVKTGTLADGTEVFHVKNVTGLVSLAQFGMIEIHPWGAPLRTPEKPDVLIWDLDPDASVPWKEVLGAAFLLRDYLAERGLKTQVKTSGGKGLHIMLYLKRKHEWEELRRFSKSVAVAIAEMNPRRFTVEASKAKRTGRIYIDWLRNGRGATCVAPWSLRARPGAPISAPLDWSELNRAEAAGVSIREPLVLPDDWKAIEPQVLSKVVLTGKA